MGNSTSNKPTRFLGLFLILAGHAKAQQWCGKNYMSNQTEVPPTGQFPTPAVAFAPLLAFRCAQSIRPFLPADAKLNPSVIVSAYFTPTVIKDSFTYLPPQGANASTSSETLSVTVSVDGQALASGSIPLDSKNFELPFDLSKLQPRKEAYTLDCQASISGQSFNTTGKLSYLPEPTSGSVTKMDLRTGGLLARSPKGEGDYVPVIPVGFYTQFQDYLTVSGTIDEIKRQGFNVIHPIPPFPDTAALDAVLDKIEQAGIYLMYDMRWTYRNTSAVTAEVNRIKSRKNLLLWYTADEPDGTSDPLNATITSYNLINSLDGGDGAGGAGYHPVSLVLNCQDYYFTEYASGADILMQDVYPFGNNVTFSSEWNTRCTTTFGDCGCDNCKGSFTDISDRMDQFAERITANGWDQTKVVWAVPQGFGNSTYWKRYPTPMEFLASVVLSFNHGARGIISWMDPTSPAIKSAFSSFIEPLDLLTSYILNTKAQFYRLPPSNNVDIATWTVPGQGTLVLASNLNYQPVNVNLNLTQLGIQGSEEHNAPQVDYDRITPLHSDSGVAWVADEKNGKPARLLNAMLSFQGAGTTSVLLRGGKSGSGTSFGQVVGVSLPHMIGLLVLQIGISCCVGLW